jgi:hypothetical protein
MPQSYHVGGCKNPPLVNQAAIGAAITKPITAEPYYEAAPRGRNPAYEAASPSPGKPPVLQEREIIVRRLKYPPVAEAPRSSGNDILLQLNTKLSGPGLRLACMHRNAFTFPVSYQWDPAKVRANRAKHGVGFADAVGVFEDPRAVTIEDPHPDEDRYVTIGLDFLGRVLVVF